jgi:ADP-heptose:LPS heptosyltransferase
MGMKNIKKLRIIDTYCGVILCFILSGFNAFFRRFTNKSKHSACPKKFLLLVVSEMGASILALPLIEKIKSQYPQAEVTIMTFDRHAFALKQLSVFKEISFVSLNTHNLGRFFLSSCEAIVKNFFKKYDVVFDLELFSRYSSIIAFISGASRRIGFSKGTDEGLYRGSLHTHKLYLNTYAHIAQNMENLLALMDAEAKSFTYVKVRRGDYKTTLPHESRAHAEITGFKETVLRGTNKRYVVMHPGIIDALPIRRWPIGNYQELSRRLKEVKNLEVVYIGDGDKNMLRGDGLDLINLVGELSIRDIVTLFYASDLFISHDCGLTHIASLTPIHSVVFFGPETPLLYGLLSEKTKVFYEGYACSPCLTAANHRNSLCNDNQCVSSISVDAVFEYVSQCLGVYK